MTRKKQKHEIKDSLPAEAFAIVGNLTDPETWQLPHHTKAIFRALYGRFDIERTVDWEGIGAAVEALSLRKRGGQRIEASPETIIRAARHLATHYQEADKSLPDILAALV